MEGRAADAPTPTIYDVAALAGVSIATVSRALNGYEYLRDETRDRVLKAVGELGFVPNVAAKQLSTRNKRVIGLAFVRQPHDDEMLPIEEEALLFTDAVIRGAEICAQRHGYALLLTGVAPGDPEHRAASLTGQCDALVVLDQVFSERQIAAVARRNPVVLLAGTGKSRSAHSVRVDNVGGMNAVAHHLVSVHGYRRLAFMAGNAESPDSQARGRAFRETATKLGAQCEPDDGSWSGDWTSLGAEQVMLQRLRRGSLLPQAIACANDQMALGVLRALRSAAIEVPRDIALTGFDDLPVARHLRPALTTVRQPAQQLGFAGVEVLLAVMEGRTDLEQRTVLPTRLMTRNSCGCLGLAVTAEEFSAEGPRPPLTP